MQNYSTNTTNDMQSSASKQYTLAPLESHDWSTPSSLSEDEELTMELMDGFSDDFEPMDRIIDTPNRQFWDRMQQKADYVTKMNRLFEEEKNALREQQEQSINSLTENQVAPHAANSTYPAKPALTPLARLQAQDSPKGLERLNILAHVLTPQEYERVMNGRPLPRMKEIHELTENQHAPRYAQPRSVTLAELAQKLSPQPPSVAAPDTSEQHNQASTASQTKDTPPPDSDQSPLAQTAPPPQYASSTHAEAPAPPSPETQQQPDHEATPPSDKQDAAAPAVEKNTTGEQDTSPESKEKQNSAKEQNSQGTPPTLPVPTWVLRARGMQDDANDDTPLNASIQPPYVTPPVQIERLISEMPEQITPPPHLTEEGKKDYITNYFKSMAAIYDAASEKYKGNDAYRAQKNARDISQAWEKLMAYAPITDNFKSPFEDELFTKSIVEIRKSADEGFIPYDEKEHDIRTMKWYELRIDPQIGFRMIYDTKDDYKDGKNATASLRVKLLYRIYGAKKAMSILNKDEPERSIEIHKLTGKYTLENTPVYLEFVGLPPGITRTHDEESGEIEDVKQNSHLDKQRSSLLTVRSVARDKNPHTYNSLAKEGESDISTTVGTRHESQEPEKPKMDDASLVYLGKVNSTHFGGLDGGFSNLRKDGENIQNELNYVDSLRAYNKIRPRMLAALYHEMTHASAYSSVEYNKANIFKDEETDAPRYEDYTILTKMPGIPKELYNANINEFLNIVKSTKDFAYSLGIDIQNSADLKEFHSTFWDNEKTDSQGNPIKSKFPLNVRELMLVLDETKKSANDHAEMKYHIEQDFKTQSWTKDNFKLEVIQSVFPAVRDYMDYIEILRKEIMGDNESIKNNNGEEPVPPTEEQLKFMQEHLNLYRNSPTMYTPSLQEEFDRAVDSENILKQVNISKNYSNLA